MGWGWGRTFQNLIDASWTLYYIVMNRMILEHRAMGNSFVLFTRFETVNEYKYIQLNRVKN